MQAVPALSCLTVKDELVIAFADKSRPVEYVPNKEADIKKWLTKIEIGSLVAMGSAGSYHELLMDCCHSHGLTPYLINQQDRRNYAKSLGARGKTDSADDDALAHIKSGALQKITY